MTGIALSTYQSPLRKVADEFNEKPWNSFDLAKRLGSKVRAYLLDYYGEAVEPRDIAHNIPFAKFGNLTFDELCKVRYSCFYMMERDVTDVFEKAVPQYMLVNKIISSMWRWGGSRDLWNNVVDAYDGIRSFDLGLPGFEVFLDHTTGVNPQGYAEYSRTFLDGVFAYLVHYKGKHVMTIGFSITRERRLLIQQIQLVKRSGNRFLFKMPKNRVEHVIGCFRAAFPAHELYIIDGHDVAYKSLCSYQSIIERDTKRLEDVLRLLPHQRRDYHEREEQICRESIVHFGERANHLLHDMPRLKAFYSDTGRYALGSAMNVNNLTHYALAA